MNRLKHLLFPILLSVLCSQAKDISSESGYWDHIVTEAVIQLDSIIEANNSIEHQQNQDASSIPNYFVDLRSNKAIPLSQSFINTLNSYIYEQQGSYLYKDKKYAAYVLITDKLAAINPDDLLLYFQGLNKVNKLDDINTGSVNSLKQAYYGVYGRPKYKYEPIVYPSETVQNAANKPVVTNYKPVETAHELAIKRIAQLSKISQSDKLGILLGIDLTYGTPSMLSNLSSNSPASAKIEVNTSVAVDKRMAPELSSSIKSDLNAEELYISYANKTLEAKIKGKTETLFQIVKGFNSPNAVYKAELESYLIDFEIKASKYQLNAKNISDKLTDQHLMEVNASQLLRLLSLTYKFQKWDRHADDLVVWILSKTPQKQAYQLYKYLDYKPKGQAYTVLAHWHDNIRPGSFDVESDMNDMIKAMKSLLKKIPISALAQELKDMAQDPVRNLNIAYDYPNNKCNTDPSLLNPKFDDAKIDLNSGEVSIDYYGIDVTMNLRTCCGKFFIPMGASPPNCYYFDHHLSTRQSTMTLGATQLVYLIDFSDGTEKVYYMPAYFLVNLTINNQQKLKEERAWLMLEVAFTALSLPTGGELGIALFLARTSAVTGLISTSAALAANLGSESMPENLKNSLNAIATSTGLVSLGTGVGSFVANFRAASKTIASGKLTNLQKISEDLQDELNNTIQHADQLGITPVELKKYNGALLQVQSNYQNVFKAVYKPKVLQEGLNQINSFSKQLATSKAIDFTGFGFITMGKGDKIIDIAIHYNGTGYSVMVEGLSVEKSIEELASVIDGVPSGYTARLLSCNDEAATLKLSEFCEKPFYASHGRVDVNKSGEVFAENDFFLFSNGQKGSAKGSGYSLGTAKGTEGVDFVRLGDGAASVGNWVELTYKGNIIGKFRRGDALEIIDSKILYGGNKINLSSDKTTTITGTLDDVNLVAKRGVNSDKTFNGITTANEVANEGGINILRSEQWGIIKNKYKSIGKAGEEVYDWTKISDEFWETVNKPWLDRAISRGDNIRLVSSPTDLKAINVTDKAGNFILDASGNKIKSIFSRELDHLKANGYTILNDGTAIK